MIARYLLPLAWVLVAAGCATPADTPRSYVVLLEDADGGTGKVVYDGPGGQTTLTQPLQAAALSGPAGPFTLSLARLQRDAGAAIAAQPRAPRRFLLYFDAGTAEITPASLALLPEILAEVRSRPVADLAIVGHTDTVGSAEQNATLSLRRAQQVAQLLKDAASAARQVEVTSHGERDLLVPTPDEIAEPRNRRVEVTVR